MYRIIIILTLTTLFACAQEADETDSRSNDASIKPQQHGIDAAGVRFNQPSTTFPSLSEPEQQK